MDIRVIDLNKIISWLNNLSVEFFTNAPRINRMEYLSGVLTLELVFAIFVDSPLWLLYAIERPATIYTATPIIIVSRIVYFVVVFKGQTARLKDFGVPGYLAFILEPLLYVFRISALFHFILSIIPGNKSSNKYGVPQQEFKGTM